jgi:S-adenosylmethionine/arginine decarboxylase-like enzyme
MMPKMPHVTWEFILEKDEDRKKLSDPIAIDTFVKQFCEKFQLTLLSTNLIYQFKGSEPDENGITAFYILSESGIHIQTWPEYSYGFVDIFSCKQFDHEAATKFIKEFFGEGEYYYDICWRGMMAKKKHVAKNITSKDILLDARSVQLQLRKREEKCREIISKKI